MLPFDSILANFGAVASIVCLVLAIAMPIIVHVWPRFFRPLGGSDIDDEPTLKANRSSAPVLTQTTFASASSNPSLGLGLQKMLESAKSVNSGFDRSEALRLVAEHTVRHGAYKKAIEAGKRIITNTQNPKP